MKKWFVFLCLMALVGYQDEGVSERRASASILLSCASALRAQEQQSHDFSQQPCGKYIVKVTKQHIELAHAKYQQKLHYDWDVKHQIWHCKGTPNKDFPASCN